MPGGRQTPFLVMAASLEGVRIKNGSTVFVIPGDWIQQAWDRLLSQGELRRSGLAPTIARYRSGYIFAVLATHPMVTIANPFPTKLTVSRATGGPPTPPT